MSAKYAIYDVKAAIKDFRGGRCGVIFAFVILIKEYDSRSKSAVGGRLQAFKFCRNNLYRFKTLTKTGWRRPTASTNKSLSFNKYWTNPVAG